MPTILFATNSIEDIFRSQIQNLKADITNLPEKDIINHSLEEWVTYYIAKYSLTAPELLDNDADLHYERDEAIITLFGLEAVMSNTTQAKGYRYTLRVNFDGESKFFFYRPSRIPNKLPPLPLQVFTVQDDYLRFYYETTGSRAETINKHFMEQLEAARSLLEILREDITQFNTNRIPFTARQLLEERKKKALATLENEKGLRFPLKARNDNLNIPTKPIKLKPALVRPTTNTASLKPEPILEWEQYELILQVIYNMAIVMERNPETFRTLKEEEVRNFFLLLLNAYFEGKVTGETFNKSGKTDILIREENKTLFIAECKFWGGAKKLDETIGQLLGYTSWRDTKTAILVFNKNKNTSAVVKEVKNTLPKHPNFKNWHTKQEEATIRCVLQHPDDKDKELHLAVMIFDVPK